MKHDHDEPVPQDFRVTFPGPFRHHDVVVDGWKVPLLQAQLVGEDRIDLLLDGRFALELGTDEAERLVPFLADAIAVALGFGSHPRGDSEPPLPRLPQLRPQRVTALMSADPD
jgi:hypothetical protein